MLRLFCAPMAVLSVGLLTLAACAPLPGSVSDVLGQSVEDVSARPVPAEALDLPPAGTYKLLELGASDPGDEWTLTLEGNEGTLSLALFDEEMNLLLQRPSRTGPVRHVMRGGARQVLAAVAGAPSDVQRVQIRALRTRGANIPPPRAQAVYLDFRAVQNLTIANRAPLSYPAFDAAVLGPQYVGATQRVKDVIVATVRAQYAAYLVELYSSDDGPPPAGDYSTIFFGGYDDALLGTAEAVDRYNTNPNDVAIVYVASFARYASMRLEPEQIGRMIGNTAGHELGHLLGLYHASGSGSLMDTRGSAWDYAGRRALGAFPLEPDVFPIGNADLARLLALTVGVHPGALLPSANDAIVDAAAAKVAAMMAADLPDLPAGACGCPHE